MGLLTVYNEGYSNATLISNRFIDEYMKDANDAQLKIYLYLTRMMSAKQETSISDIADKFNHTEKDVLRALKYWEKQQLLSLDYDTGKNLVGIHLKDLQSNLEAEAVQSAQKPLVSIISTQTTLRTEEITAPTVYEKPNYSLDELKSFKNTEEASQILFIAESYLGKTLSANDIKTIFFFYDKLNFSTDLVDYLIQYCVERDKKDFKYIERVAINWAEQGITTPKQAAALSKKYDKTVYTIMKTLGKANLPTNKEVEFITKWSKEFGFSLDIIIEACDRTVLATDSHRFEYADSILTNWHKAGVHHKADIEVCDKNFKKTKTAVVSNKTVTSNKFNQFPQRSYDFDKLEEELLNR